MAKRRRSEEKKLKQQWGEKRDSQRLWVVSFLLLLLGFWTAAPAPEPISNYGEPFRIAMNLYRDGHFANPYMTLPTGPTAHLAPGYPFLLSLVLRLFGDGVAGWRAVGMLATLAQSAQYALLPWVAARLGFSAWLGVVAALLGLWVGAPREEIWECQLAGVLVMLLTTQMLRGDWRTGVLAGVSFLIQPVLAGTYFLWAALSRRWLLIAIPIAICAPWIARTYVMLGGITWVRSTFGLEMAVSFNECTPYGMRESERILCFEKDHPNVNETEAKKVLTLGEYRYNQEKLRTAVNWVSAHPARTASLIVQRIWYFWFPADFGWTAYKSQTVRFASLHILTVLSFIGLWLSWRRRIPGVGLLTLWLGAFPLAYYLAQFEVRYRTPILWIIYLLAAFALQAMVERIRSGWSRATMKIPRNATV